MSPAEYNSILIKGAKRNGITPREYMETWEYFWEMIDLMRKDTSGRA